MFIDAHHVALRSDACVHAGAQGAVRRSMWGSPICKRQLRRSKKSALHDAALELYVGEEFFARE
jgi:hypothetical protein